MSPKIAGNWTFSRDGEWAEKYTTCNKRAARISPININTSRTSPCNALCRLSLKYEPSTCSISMLNNIPTVTFSPNSLIKFKNEFYYLNKMTIHHSSMHTIDGSYTDLEILLYHNKNPLSDVDGGIILSILLKKGGDYGPVNQFMNEFINKMPSNEMPIEQDVSVSPEWSPISLLPKSKSFYYYDGALPYPPCDQKWTFIIFQEIVQVSMNIINTVKYMIGPDNKNIRPIQRTPPNITMFYNSNSNFDGIQDISDEAINAAIAPVATVPAINALGSASWLKQNIYYIKGIVITIILILLVYTAIKFAQIIVSNDLLNSFIIKQIKKKQAREYEVAQKQMANQQAAEYGGVAPVEKPANTGNNNNNNNNGGGGNNGNN